jgi:hypothetical protein
MVAAGAKRLRRPRLQAGRSPPTAAAVKSFTGVEFGRKQPVERRRSIRNKPDGEEGCLAVPQTTSTTRLPCASRPAMPGTRGSIHARNTRLVVLPTRSQRARNPLLAQPAEDPVSYRSIGRGQSADRSVGGRAGDRESRRSRNGLSATRLAQAVALVRRRKFARKGKKIK